MARRLHVAVVGMRSENSSFSPFRTTLEDFRPVRDADTLRLRYQAHVSAQPGQRLDLAATQPPLERSFDDVDFTFVFQGQAMPGGPIEAEAYAQMKAWVVGGLQQAHAERPLDGVWLDLHGAMFVEGLEDCEGDLLAAVRSELVGAPLLSVSFDLHGNFSERLAGLVDICSGFRTAPHVDEFETELKALTLLVRCLRTGQRPGLAYVKVPLAVSGEMSNTADEPTKGLYAEVLHEADNRADVRLYP